LKLRGIVGKADVEGRSQNCREQPELPGTVGTAGKADVEGRSQNCREQSELQNCWES